MYPVSNRRKAIVSDNLALSKQSHRKKRAVSQLPCVSFGNCSLYKRSYFENSVNSDKRRSNTFRLNKGHYVRGGKPTIGELNLNSHDHRTSQTRCQRKDKNSNDLMLMCQKVERIKQLQGTGDTSRRADKPSPLRFTVPPFPVREEFVFRAHHELQDYGTRNSNKKLQRKYLRYVQFRSYSTAMKTK